ncbi:Hypothetical protein R9X50_00061900 [Acrodontium crateriforme]|uniref:Uncharacterized protein n=1 Tax=Acrodontium crateriforme TaxID=150365 RepID=A0AAQ3R525_9PEZI|nr:Hypothetical protein R9X50_00061900 [Acrodontium crateriforme]
MSQQTNSKPSGLANNSPWNDSGFAFAPNTNVMDPESMPSAEAQAARARAAEIMAALKKGEPGDADKLMGKESPRSGRRLFQVERAFNKITGKSTTKDEKALEAAKAAEEKVVR